MDRDAGLGTSVAARPMDREAGLRTSTAARAVDREAGPVMHSLRGAGQVGAGSEPPSMDLSQLGYLLLWIQYDPHLSQVIPPCRLLRRYEVCLLACLMRSWRKKTRFGGSFDTKEFYRISGGLKSLRIFPMLVL